MAVCQSVSLSICGSCQLYTEDGKTQDLNSKLSKNLICSEFLSDKTTNIPPPPNIRSFATSSNIYYASLCYEYEEYSVDEP